MRLYFSTRCLRHPTDLAAVLELYRMAELRTLVLDGTQALPREAFQALKGFDLLVHHAFPPSEERFGLNLAAGDEDFRLRTVKRMEASIEFCAAHGAPLFSLMPGFALEETLSARAPSHPISRSRALDQLKRSLDRLAGRAEALGVAIALTNSSARHAAMLLSEAGEIGGVFSDLQIPFLGLQVDLDHLQRASERLRFPREAFFEELENRVLALRLHENHRLPVEEGWMEERVRTFQGPVILEAHRLELSQLLEVKDRLESLAVSPLLGPFPPVR